MFVFAILPCILPEVSSVVEVPCGGVADNVAPIVRLFKQRFLPEHRRNGVEPYRREELVCQLEHRRRVVALHTASIITARWCNG